MGLLTGKTALITGAARGIGKAIALKFAEEGANIAFTDLVIDENGKATEAEIAAKGVKCIGYASNAADFAQTAEVVGKVKEDFGSIDILVNNAGITKDGLMMRMTEQQWDAVIAVNLKSAFNFIHAGTPIMMRQRSGSVINMASVVGVPGNGLARHPRQCHRAGFHRDGHDGRPARGCAQGLDQQNPPAPRRPRRGHRQRGSLPGQ